MPQATPLHHWHLSHGGRMVDFAGWSLPVNYQAGIIAEHLACRRWAALFDISHMGRFLLEGPGALAFLRRALTNDAALLTPGRSHYTLLSDPQGRPLDDAYLFHLAPESYLLVVNAANRETDWQWLAGLPAGEMSITDRTQALAMLALQGPRSQAVLAGLLQGTLPAPGRNRHDQMLWRGEPVLVSRTGYTGEPYSFELILAAGLVEDLWSALLTTGAGEGLVPAGLGARDTLRLEAGLPLFGHEYQRDRPLLSVPLARFGVYLGLERGDFAGRAALEAQAAELATDQGRELVPRRILAVAATERAMIREGSPVLAGGGPVGELTSGTTAPAWRFAGEAPGDEHFTRAIGLGYLDRDLRLGQEVEIEYRGRRVKGLVVKSFVGRAGDYLKAIEY